MSIRDFSNVPDERCPAWVLEARIRRRGEAARYREQQEYFEKHLKLSESEREKLWGQWGSK